MNKNERTVINTTWSYFRDHAKTPEQIALKNSLGKLLKNDLKRRNSKEKAKKGDSYESIS